MKKLLSLICSVLMTISLFVSLSIANAASQANATVPIQLKSSSTAVDTSQSEYSLKGAVFTFYADQNKKTVLGTAKTDASGVASFSKNLKYPTASEKTKAIYMEETKAPNHYVRDSGLHKITLKSDKGLVFDGKTVKNGARISVCNTPMRRIVISLTTENPVGWSARNGLKASIYQDKNRTKLLESITTDSNGKAQTKKYYTQGTYYLTIDKCPDNVKPEYKKYKINVTKDGFSQNGKCNPRYFFIEYTSQPIFLNSGLPKDFVAGESSAGKVTFHDVGKGMYVYTPYGYNKNTKYNVIIMAHGQGGHAREFMDTKSKHDVVVNGAVQKVAIPQIWDYMIEKKLMNPLIVVGYEYPLVQYNTANLDTHAKYIKETILPYVIKNYSTYASSSSPAAIRKARDHFAMGGFSLGSMYTFSVGMERLLPYFSSFVGLSGVQQSGNVVKALKSDEYKDYDINYMCIYAGTSDAGRRGCSNGFNEFVKTNKLTKNQNAFYIEAEKGGHNWQNWSTGVFDTMQRLFAGQD